MLIGFAHNKIGPVVIFCHVKMYCVVFHLHGRNYREGLASRY